MTREMCRTCIVMYMLLRSPCAICAQARMDAAPVLPQMTVELEHVRLLIGEMPRVKIRIDAKDRAWNIIKPERLALAGNMFFHVTDPDFERRPGQYVYSIGSGPKGDDWIKLTPGTSVEGIVPVNLRPCKPGLHLISVSLSPTGNPHAQATVVLKLTVEQIEPENISSRLDGTVRVSDDVRRPSDFDGTVSFLILKTDAGRELVYHFRAAKPDGDMDVVTSRLWKLDHDVKLLDIAVSATQAETYNHEIWLTYEQQGETYLLRLRQNGATIVSVSKLAPVQR